MNTDPITDAHTAIATLIVAGQDLQHTLSLAIQGKASRGRVYMFSRAWDDALEQAKRLIPDIASRQHINGLVSQHAVLIPWPDDGLGEW